MSEHIKNELAKYNLPDAAIAQMREDYLDLAVTSVEDMDNYLICKEAHQEVKKIRISIDKKRLEINADAQSFIGANNAEGKRLTSEVKEIEDHLQAQRAVVEDEKKRITEKIERDIREAEEKAKRDEEERLESVRKEQEAKEKELREKEEAIQAKELAQEAEARRLKDEADRQEREKQEAIDAKKRAEQDEKNRIEREKLQAIAIEKAKIEAAEKAIRDKEAEDAAEKARIERDRLLAPDKEKLILLRDSIDGIAYPDVKSSDAKAITDQVNVELTRTIRMLSVEIEKL